MAANTTTACEVLLQKLKQQQFELQRSVRALKSDVTATSHPKTTSTVSNCTRGRQKLAVHETPFDRVDHLPRKKARLDQLSPKHEETPQKERTRCRLSSTPKASKSTQPTPSIDFSLEDALFSGSKPDNEGSHLSYHLPSPKLSQVVVNTSRRLATPSKPNPGTSILSSSKKHSTKRQQPKKRGLSVSFIQNENSSPIKGSSPKRRKRVSGHSVREELGGPLVDSLNSSRFGALDRQLSEKRKTRKFPRKYTGDDPRLGYDWIAGLLDTSDLRLNEKDDEYFAEMKEFRRVNHSECFKSEDELLPEGVPTSSSTSDDIVVDDGGNCTTCVSSYLLNNRLFPVRVHSSKDDGCLGAQCPVCEDKHSKVKSPSRYIRVSVPHSTLQAPYRLRPHRRRSFDQTDSVALSKHCLAGWENAQPSIIPSQPPISLKSVTSNKQHQRKKQVRELLNTSHVVEYNLRSRGKH